eukprot:310170_1
MVSKIIDNRSENCTISSIIGKYISSIEARCDTELSVHLIDERLPSFELSVHLSNETTRKMHQINTVIFDSFFAKKCVEYVYETEYNEQISSDDKYLFGNYWISITKLIFENNDVLYVSIPNQIFDTNNECIASDYETKIFDTCVNEEEDLLFLYLNTTSGEFES